MQINADPPLVDQVTTAGQRSSSAGDPLLGGRRNVGGHPSTMPPGPTPAGRDVIGGRPDSSGQPTSSGGTTTGGQSTAGGHLMIGGYQATGGQPSPSGQDAAGGQVITGGSAHGGSVSGGQIIGGALPVGGQSSPVGGDVTIGGQPSVGPDPQPGGGGVPIGGEVGVRPVFASQNPRARFKGVERISKEFSRILEMPENELCEELGQYSCLGQVHRITLGGVEPYRANIYTPVEGTAMTAPVAIDRVALQACARRFDLDEAQPDSAILFYGLPVDPAGRHLRELGHEGVTLFIQRLFTRSFLRRPTDIELEQFRQLYTDIQESPQSLNPVREWGTLSCFVALTSIESLFY